MTINASGSKVRITGNIRTRSLPGKKRGNNMNTAKLARLRTQKWKMEMRGISDIKRYIKLCDEINKLEAEEK